MVFDFSPVLTVLIKDIVSGKIEGMGFLYYLFVTMSKPLLFGIVSTGSL